MSTPHAIIRPDDPILDELLALHRARMLQAPAYPTVPAALHALARHLGDLMEQIDSLACAVEHRKEDPDFLRLALADLRSLLEGADHA